MIPVTSCLVILSVALLVTLPGVLSKPKPGSFGVSYGQEHGVGSPVGLNIFDSLFNGLGGAVPSSGSAVPSKGGSFLSSFFGETGSPQFPIDSSQFAQLTQSYQGSPNLNSDASEVEVMDIEIVAQ